MPLASLSQLINLTIKTERILSCAFMKTSNLEFFSPFNKK